MQIEKLATVLKSEPAYRTKQAYQLIYRDLIDDWQLASNLPLALREKLDAVCPLEITGEIFKSNNRHTFKALITLDDGLEVETVLMRHSDGRQTICLSSQVGCPLGCQFCATGAMGFRRNLTRLEIVSQALFWARYLKNYFGTKITNVVFMGMGEPFLNYDQVLGAIKVLNDKEGLNIGARHISISTAGLIDGIKKLAKEKLQVNLAISLHAPNDKLRTQIMPINKKYPLAKLLAAVNNYLDQAGRRVMFEYILIRGVNDSPKHAEELAQIMKHPLYLVNLVSYNDTGKFQAAEHQAINEFKRILERNKIAFTERYRFGTEIAAACGQLANRRS